jgi:hypothetical protein
MYINETLEEQLLLFIIIPLILRTFTSRPSFLMFRINFFGYLSQQLKRV